MAFCNGEEKVMTIEIDIPLHYVSPEELKKILTAHNHRTNYIDFAKGKEIRNALYEIAVRTYTPKYPALYMQFLNNEKYFTLDTVSPQDNNHPEYFCFFSVTTQHIYGDCIEEVLDKAIEIKINKEMK